MYDNNLILQNCPYEKWNCNKRFELLRRGSKHN